MPRAGHRDSDEHIYGTSEDTGIVDVTHQPIVYIDLGVGGMTCDDCAERVTDALKSVRGVRHASVSLSDRSARVEATPDVAGSALALAVRDAGPPAGHRYNAFERRRQPSVGPAEGRTR